MELLLIFLGLVGIWYVFFKKDDVDHEKELQLVRQNFMLLNDSYGKIPLYEGNSSYTENKKTITLCIRDPQTKQYYDRNTIMYVALHELAHTVSKKHGHGDEFKENFTKILKDAQLRGIYDPHRPIPQNYCPIC